MPKPIPREQVQMTLQIMGTKAREAREVWERELAACREKGLIKPDNTGPASLTERFAHKNMSELMLHIAVTHLICGGVNGQKADRYTRDLIAGERWPTER